MKRRMAAGTREFLLLFCSYHNIYDVGLSTINEHIKKIYADGELTEESTIRKFRIVQAEGSRQINREVAHFKPTNDYCRRTQGQYGADHMGECARWQDSENRHGSTCTMRARRTSRSPAAALRTTHIRSIRNWTTSAAAPSTGQTARRSTSAWTGSRRTACGRGATGAPSSSARRGTLKFVSMWMLARSATAATMCSLSTTKASSTSTRPG